MVSTRGGARTSGGTATEQSLRKKPVRKTATAKTTQTAAKAKTTRVKRPDPAQEAADIDDEQDELQDDSATPTVKPTRRIQAKKPKEAAPKPVKKAAARVKRNVDSANAPTAKPAAKVGRPKGTMKIVETKSVEGESKKPELLPPTEPKGTRATRATGATTSTAAKGRVPPLSPKKITQVSRAPPRAAVATAARTAVTKAAVSKSVPKGRPATRKRNVSDENAEVLKLPAIKQTLREDVEVHEKEPSPGDAGEVVKEETTRPARPETPEAAPEPAVEHDAQETTQDQDAVFQSDGDSDSDALSVDELLGPKTPLKRCSPREVTRSTSARKSVPRMELSMRTPVRRFAALGTQQGTPQTQKPYCKPSIPMSEVRPMTVARACDRAMVFPKLQALPKLRDNEDVEDWEESDTPEEQETGMLAEGASKTHSPMLLTEEQASSDEATPELGDLDDNISRMQESELLESEDDAKESQMNNAIEIEDDGKDSEALAEDVDEGDVEIEDSDLPEYADDGEMDDENEVTSTVSEELAARKLDISTFLASRETEADCHAQDMDVSMEVAPRVESNPQLETLVWENLQEDITIPFNFEVDLSASRTLPPVEPTERLSIAASHEAEILVEPTLEQDAEAEGRIEDGELPSMIGCGELSSTRTSVDATVNLSDFLYVESLVEPKQHHQGARVADSENTASVSPDMDASDDGSPSPMKAPAIPARDIDELDVTLEDIQDDRGFEIPRYARPTIASRRKSLPAIFYRTPTKDIDRPMTAAGASMPRVAIPYGNYLFADSTMPSRVTPARPRLSTAHGLVSEKKLRKASQTPITGSPMARAPGISVPNTMQSSRMARSPSRTSRPRLSDAVTPDNSVPNSARPTPRERFPGLPSRAAYDLENTPIRATPMTNKVVQAERFPGLPPQDSYDSFNEDAQMIGIKAAGASSSVHTPKASQSAAKERYPGLPPSDAYAESLEVGNKERVDEGTPSTPVHAAGERYPGLPSKRSYAEHAMTAEPPSRFQTPVQSPAKQPATVQKPASLRKVALKATTPWRTPLKARIMTPGLEPMTPHPAAPLRGVLALVEVFTSDGGCATPAFTVLLQRLGAKTTKTFSERITHLVFKEGSPTTLQRLRVHNKQVIETGFGNEIYCVNSRWVSDCDTGSKRMEETNEAYAVDVEDVPRAGKRRRKSMEPASLRNIGGNVVRDRKSTLGRSSLSRASLKPESPSELDVTPKGSMMDQENSVDDRSPATPAYLAAPDSLVQQTAPMNRVRKLDFSSKESEKSRRLTSLEF